MVSSFIKCVQKVFRHVRKLPGPALNPFFT
jgi:hypothetical protein